ncbi:fibrous sheath-interacting protein 2 [Pogoniulus pusillus]|uniref:fibrous sheath-interacting protein 2 n=1 Tax=Pogoniulus pusillus TaxID=488313 RepID=UPI0030B95ADB
MPHSVPERHEWHRDSQEAFGRCIPGPQQTSAAAWRCCPPKPSPHAGMQAPRQLAAAGYRRQPLGKGASRLMDPKEFLDLPLGVKISVPPNSKPVFVRTKLGEKLHRPSGYFDLGDPYCRLLPTEYNSLHDPYLRDYHSRKDNMERLKTLGHVTSNGKVTCTLTEFNQYRQYLTTHKLEAEKVSRREEERLGQEADKGKDAVKLPAVVGTPCLPHPRKPACPPPAKSTKTKVVLERDRGAKSALEQPPAGGLPQVGKSERERSGRRADSSQTSRVQREAPSRFGGAPGSDYLEILGLPRDNLSKRQLCPSQTPSPEESTADMRRLSRALAKETISQVQQQHAQPTWGARDAPRDTGAPEREMKAKATALASALAARTTASQISDTVLDLICHAAPALSPEMRAVRRQAVRLPPLGGGKQSCASEDTLPLTRPRVSRQPVPPASPKPPTEGGRRRPVHLRPA